MMIDRIEGNAELKKSVRMMLDSRRMTHSLLLVGEEGLGAGFAARCVAADYLYPAGGAPAEALLRGECCRAVGKPGDRDSGRVETGIVREAISITGMGSGGRYLVSQVKAMRTEIFNTSLSAEGRAVLLYHVERMNEESANALLKVLEEPPEGVLFLLTASCPAAVLATIRSRCAAYDLSPLPPAQCAAWLKNQRPACREAEFLAAVYEGSPGRCLAAVDDPEVTAGLNAARQLAGLVKAGQEYEILVLLARYEKDKPGAFLLLSQFASLCAAALADPERAGLPAKAAGRCLYRVAAARKALEGNANTKLVLTNLGIRLARANR